MMCDGVALPHMLEKVSRNQIWRKPLSVCLLLMCPTLCAQQQVVEKLHAVLIENMQHANTRSCEQRLIILQPVLTASFNFSFLGRQILRRDWKSLEVPQQQEFLTLLQQEVGLTFASQFNDFNGETFSVLSVESSSPSQATVRAELTRPEQEAVKFNYVLLQESENAEWRIVNIIANGISDLAMRSAQYRTAIRDSQFSGFINDLKQQIDEKRNACKNP